MLAKKKRAFSFLEKYLLVPLIFLVCSLIVFRNLLFAPGTIGHHWDWSIPPTASYLTELAEGSFYLWNSQFLGYFIGFGIPVFVPNYILGYAGFFGLSGDLVSKFLLIITVIISGCSMYYLVKDILSLDLKIIKTRNEQKGDKIIELSSIMAGYFYALSPFAFNEFVGGANTQFIAYSFAPLVLLFYRKAHTNSIINWKYIFLTALSFTIISISLQRTILLLAIMFLYGILRGRKGFLALIMVLLVWLPINAYWILPESFLAKTITANVMQQGRLEAMLTNLKIHAPSFPKAFIATGYWTDFFSNTIPSLLYPLWFFVVSTIVIAMFSIVILKLKNRQAFFWIILALLSVIFVTGSQPPLGELVEWLYTYVPVMVLFEGPQQFIFVLTFSYAILWGLAINLCGMQLKKRSFVSISALFLVLTSVWIAPFYSGNLGGHVDLFRLPPDYEHINQIVGKVENQDYRVLYLPMAFSPFYEKTEYQSVNQGGDPIIHLSLQPAVVADSVPNQYAKQFATLLEKMIYGKNPPENISKLLGIINVKYIVLRRDVKPAFGPSVSMWNYTLVYNNLKAMKGIEPAYEGQYASLWENMDYFPKIFAAPSPFLIKGGGIDQAQPLYGSGDFRLKSSLSANLLAQTFVPNTTSIDRVDIMVASIGSPDGDLVVMLQTTKEGMPSGEILVSSTISKDSIHDWNWVSATISLDGLIPGKTYAIVLDKTTSALSYDNSFAWAFRDDLDHYVMGTSYYFSERGWANRSNTTDFAFKIYSEKRTQDEWSYIIVDEKTLTRLALSRNFVSFQKINPTKYVIQVNASEPFFLIFGESYHQSWIAYIDKQQVPNEYHFVANAFANSWYINKTGTCTITLEFWPQKLFHIGSTISIATLILCILYISKDKIKTIHHRYIKKNKIHFY